MIIHGIILTDSTAVGRIKPFGAYRIANHLRNHGYNIMVIDHMTFLYKHKILFNILEKFICKETIFVGYSSSLFITSYNSSGENSIEKWFTLHREDLIIINEFIKKCNSNIDIIFGGSSSKSMQTYYNNSGESLGIDIVVHGYAETMILDYLSSKISKTFKRDCSVLELSYDAVGSKFDFHNSHHQWHEWDLIDWSESLPLEVSRGCIFKCKFCSFPLLGKNPKDLSYIKSEDNLIREIQENYEKYNTTHYWILDDTFNENDEKIYRLLRIRDKTKINLTLAGYNRLDLLTRKPHQIELLRDLNFIGHCFGIESLNHKSAMSIGKGLRPEETIETLYKIRDIFNNKVSLTGSFIIGLPHETPETLQKGMSLILKKDSPLDFCNISPLQITETSHTSSEFFINPEKYGYKIENINGSVFWQNEHFDYSSASKIAKKLYDYGIQNDIFKVSGTIAMGITQLGFDYQTLIKTSMSAFDYNELNHKLNLRKISYAKKILNISVN